VASTWSGWQRQFLTRAGIIITPPNLNLLSLWAQNSATNCDNNPIDLSQTVAGSPNCGELHGIFPHAKHYSSHRNAATAFRTEINMSFAHALLVAMNTGNPFQAPNFNDAASVFVSWGTPKMLDVFLNQGHTPGGGGGGGSAGIHKGWADLQRSVGKGRLGKKVTATNRMDAATLRAIRRAHKVRLK